jgi:hypothetical protein
MQFFPQPILLVCLTGQPEASAPYHARGAADSRLAVRGGWRAKGQTRLTPSKPEKNDKYITKLAVEGGLSALGWKEKLPRTELVNLRELQG